MRNVILIISAFFFTSGLLQGQDNSGIKVHSIKEKKELKWSFNLSIGGMISGYGNELKDAFIKAGYDKSYRSIITEKLISHPRTDFSLGYTTGINRRLSRYFTLGLNFDKNGAEVTGFNGFNTVIFDYSILAISPIIQFTPIDIIHLGGGPAYSVVNQ